MRIIVSSASVLLLLGMLSVAPFVHSHSGEEAIIHGHLGHDEGHFPLDEESFEPSDHDGQSLDLFASVSVELAAGVACLDECPRLMAPSVLSRLDWSGWSLRVRGPPPPELFSRPPPFLG